MNLAGLPQRKTPRRPTLERPREASEGLDEDEGGAATAAVSVVEAGEVRDVTASSERKSAEPMKCENQDQ